MKEGGEERYWGRFASTYDRDGEFVVGKPILQAIQEALSNERSLGRAVEFGCGTGYFTKAVARNAAQVVATDLSPEMVNVARSQLGQFDNVTIQVADCAGTSFPGGSFDSVIMINLIHVMDDPSSCLREGHRILRGGGSLIVVDLTGYGMSFCQKMKLGFRYVRAWGLPPRGGRNNLSPDELVSLVKGTGFRVEQVQLLEDGSNAVYLKGVKA